MPYIPDPHDPFSRSERMPSLSWKNLPVGSTFELLVTEPAKLLQGRDFETNLPSFWDAPQNTQPKMSAVINVVVVHGPHSVGELRSIWAQKPSNLFVALANAQKAADAPFAPDGTLHLRFIGEKPHVNPRNNPIKQYEAKYVPPRVDVFAESPTPVASGWVDPPPIAVQTPPWPSREW